jgi:hypothetical protein
MVLVGAKREGAGRSMSWSTTTMTRRSARRREVVSTDLDGFTELPEVTLRGLAGRVASKG